MKSGGKVGGKNSDDYEAVAEKGKGKKVKPQSLKDIIVHIFRMYPVDITNALSD